MPPKPNFPFSDAHPFPVAQGISAGHQISQGTYGWLGGNLVPVPGTAANFNLPIAHGLNRVPRFAWLVDCGKNINVTSPVPRGISTGWNSVTAYFNWPSTGDKCLLLFG